MQQAAEAVTGWLESVDKTAASIASQDAQPKEDAIPPEIRSELEDAGVVGGAAAAEEGGEGGEDGEQYPSASMREFHASVLELGKKLEVMPPSVKKELKGICKSIKEQGAKIKSFKEENDKEREKAKAAAEFHRDEIQSLRAANVEFEQEFGVEKSAHSSFEQQMKLRESAVKAENAAYRKAIDTAEKHIRQKNEEQEQLALKLEEEGGIRAELESKLAALSQSREKSQADDSAAEQGVQELRKKEEQEKVQRNMETLKSKQATLSSMREDLAAIREEVDSTQSSEERSIAMQQRLQSLSDQLQRKHKKKEDIHREVELLKMNVVTLEAQQRERQNPKDKQKSRKSSSALDASGAATKNDGDDDNSKKRRPKGRLAPAMKVAQSFDAIGLYAISNQGLRSVGVVYILGLHIIVMIVLFLAQAKRAFFSEMPS